ncbi:MAG: hypothetical protein K6A23_15340 [Butyrivibrio sp.]|nr:hypothetical protein [Butyrivibrio sp.]
MANFTKENFETLATYNLNNLRSNIESTSNQFARRIGLFEYVSIDETKNSTDSFNTMFQKDAFGISDDGTVDYNKVKTFFTQLGHYKESHDAKYGKAISKNKDALSGKSYFKDKALTEYYDQLQQWVDTNENIKAYNVSATADKKISKDTIQTWFNEGYNAAVAKANEAEKKYLKTYKDITITQKIKVDRENAKKAYYTDVKENMSSHFSYKLKEIKGQQEIAAESKKENAEAEKAEAEEKAKYYSAINKYYSKLKATQEKIKKNPLKTDNVQKCFTRNYNNFLEPSVSMLLQSTDNKTNFGNLTKTVNDFVTKVGKNPNMDDYRKFYNDTIENYNNISRKANEYIKKNSWGPWGMFNIFKFGKSKQKYQFAKNIAKMTKDAIDDFSKSFTIDNFCRDLNEFSQKDLKKMTPSDCSTILKNLDGDSRDVLDELGMSVKEYNSYIDAGIMDGYSTKYNHSDALDFAADLTMYTKNFRKECNGANFIQYDDRNHAFIADDKLAEFTNHASFGDIISSSQVSKTSAQNLEKDLNMAPKQLENKKVSTNTNTNTHAKDFTVDSKGGFSMGA